MPFEDFVVCDADMHIFEPADLWQRYIAPEFKHAAPIGMTELKRDIRVKVKSQVLLRAGPVRPLKERGGRGIGWRPEQEAAYDIAEARGWDATAQLEAMDREGVDLTVLFPTRGLFVSVSIPASRSGPTGSSPTLPPPSRVRTTTGCTTSARQRPIDCTGPRWWPPTTSPRRSRRPDDVSRNTSSRRSIWRREP